jgi:hypothetical protein
MAGKAEQFDDDEALAEWLLQAWDEGNGTSKSQLEIRVWEDPTSHGRRFDRFVRGTLGVSTTKPSKQTDRIADMERQIRGLGEIPAGTRVEPWETQVQHARSACLAALRVWNDPTATFRSGAFSLLFVTAWNSLAISILQRRGAQWWKGEPGSADERLSLDTNDLVAAAFDADERRGLRANVGVWVDIRNAVAHRHLPSLDVSLIPYAQAGLLNIESALVDLFGPEFALGAALSVPLQLSGFRDPGVLLSRRKQQASLPIAVQAALSSAGSADATLLSDETYLMRVAFIPVVPGSGRNPDAVAYFVRPGEVPDELGDALERYVVLPKPTHGARPNIAAKDVMAEVERRTGNHFHSGLHADAARSLGAWPAKGEPDRTCNVAFAEYITSFKRYLYTQAWIDHLAKELADPVRWEAVTGKPPKPLAASK